ncbi:hypothetical protein GCM10022291_28020 [Postechiella marina]|uniref:Uncharacterized protein n=1 Tax=Postechiella marina TaxID=943941 RepID=A0ABP8CE97_9FLAO
MTNLIKASKAIAVVSFIWGTSLFLLQLYTNNPYKLPYFGLIFIILAAIINTILVIILLYKIIKYKNRQIEILKTIGFMLLNIPIATLYFIIIIPTIY